MENAIKLDDKFVVGGQPAPDDLEKMSKQGVKSVLNLRTADEEGFLKDEAKQAEARGLKYSHIPVDAKSIDDNLTDRVLREIKELPKPLLVHCKSGMRAGAMTMMHLALEKGWDSQQALGKAQEQGFDCGQNPQLKQYFESYVDKHNRKNK